MIIGLTGSYGSGKTTVTEMFRTLGARIIDADVIAREIVEPTMPAYHEIVAEFGNEVVQENGQLNRRKIKELIFSRPALRQKLNQIMHPRIREIELERLREWRTEPLVVLSAPLLLENQLDKYVDKIVVVTVSAEKRIERLQKRDNVTVEEINRVLAVQMPEAEKIKRADFVIDNSGTLEETFKSVQQLVKQLGIQVPGIL
ncbi:MAG: dephospho-CoA kinase [Candidatus Sumerlaeia bacterium]|nr:dephospho-CoA kinase [Candidatus Sumerlaeia bacterium]